MWLAACSPHPKQAQSSTWQTATAKSIIHGRETRRQQEKAMQPKSLIDVVDFVCNRKDDISGLRSAWRTIPEPMVPPRAVEGLPQAPRGLPHPQHQTIRLFSLINLAPWLGGGRTTPEHKAPQGSSKGSPRLAEDTPTRQSSTCIFPNLSNLIWGSRHSRNPSPRRPFQKHPQASQRTLPPPTPFPPPHLTKHIFFVLC